MVTGLPDKDLEWGIIDGNTPRGNIKAWTEQEELEL